MGLVFLALFAVVGFVAAIVSLLLGGPTWLALAIWVGPAVVIGLPLLARYASRKAPALTPAGAVAELANRGAYKA